MASVTIATIRKKYNAESDAEAAAAWAKQYGLLVVIRYKREGNDEYTNFAECGSREVLLEYLKSPDCHDVELIYGADKAELWKSSAINNLTRPQPSIPLRKQLSKPWWNFLGKSKEILELPPIGSEHLHHNFDNEPSEPSGSGAHYLPQAKELWNSGDFEKSFDLFTAAIADGVNTTWEATAHDCLGQIFQRRGNLETAIWEYLQVLLAPERDIMTASHAALSLSCVYSEAGRLSEAQALALLAAVANKSYGYDMDLSFRAKSELRNLARKEGAT